MGLLEGHSRPTNMGNKWEINIEAETFLIIPEFNSSFRWLVYSMRLELGDSILVTA